MLVKLSRDAARLNSILNHPQVYPWVRGELKELDATNLVKRPTTILLESENGMFLFDGVKPGQYVVHTQFLPGNKNTLECAKDAVKYIFEHTPAQLITTVIPTVNKKARALAKNVGFIFSRTHGTFPVHGKEYPLEHFVLTRKNWSKS